MVVNSLRLQIQANILGIPVIHPIAFETRALDASYGAGLAFGFSDDLGGIRSLCREDARWKQTAEADARDRGLVRWHRAACRIFDSVD